MDLLFFFFKMFTTHVSHGSIFFQSIFVLSLLQLSLLTSFWSSLSKIERIFVWNGKQFFVKGDKHGKKYEYDKKISEDEKFRKWKIEEELEKMEKKRRNGRKESQKWDRNENYL